MEEVEKFNQTHSPLLPDFAQNLSLALKKKYEAYHQIDSLQESHSLEKIFSFVIPEYAKDIVELEAKKVQLIHAFHQMKNFIECESRMEAFFSAEEILDDEFTYPIHPMNLTDLTIAAVDGSFVRKSYTNFDFSLFRAISVVYSFTPKGIEIHYYPAEKGMENYRLDRILTNTTDQVATSLVSIDRAFMEVRLVNNMITNYNSSIDMIILDGSILYEPLNLLSNASENTDLMIKYSKLVKEYKKLYALCDLRKIDLIGVVKDTRSSTFRKLISRRIPQIISKLNDKNLLQIDYRKLLPYFSDLDLFHRFLNIGERSCVFSINSARNSWIPRQLELLNTSHNPHSNFLTEYKFYACYMKPVRYDFPIRIEFHQKKENSSKNIIQAKTARICERLFPLCSKLEGFAIPIPQIEAHLRAKLSENDLNMIIQLLNRHIGDELQNYSKYDIFNRLEPHNMNKFDDFLIKNNFLIPKRRERMPL